MFATREATELALQQHLEWHRLENSALRDEEERLRAERQSERRLTGEDIRFLRDMKIGVHA